MSSTPKTDPEPADAPRGVWRDLVEQLRAAFYRPERERLAPFLCLWLILMSVCAAPLAAAYSLAVLTGPAAEDAVAPVTQATIGPPAVITEIGQKRCILALCASVPKLWKTLKTDSALEKEIRDKRLRLLAGLGLFWAFGLSVFWSQTRIAKRYWQIANEDRVSGKRYRLCDIDHKRLEVLFFGAVLWCVGAAIAAGLMSDPTPPAAALVLVFGVGVAWLALSYLHRQHSGIAPALVGLDPPKGATGPTTRQSLRFAIAWLPLPTCLVGLSFGFLVWGQLTEHQKTMLTLTSVGGDPDRAFWAIAMAASVALMFVSAVMTAFGTYSYGWDVPAHDKAKAVLDGVLDESHRADEVTDQLWAMLRAGVKFDLVKGQAVGQPEKAQALFQPLPVLSRTSAKTGTDVVRLLARPLAILIVAALVVLALADNVMAIRITEGGSPATAPSAGLIWLALAMTVSFAVITVVPLVRIGPYVADPPKEAAKAEVAASPVGYDLSVASDALQDIIRAVARDARGQIGETAALKLASAAPQVAPPDPTPVNPLLSPGTGVVPIHTLMGDSETLEERVLRRHIGADKAKFKTILASVSTGAIFQTLLGDGLQGQAASLLALISPAAVATFLEFIK